MSPLPRFRLGPHGHLGTIIQIQIYTGADPGFEKGGGAGGSGARPQDFLGQFRGLFKVFGAKRVGRKPPCAPLPLAPRLLQAICHELQLTIATQTYQQESSTTKEMMTGIPRRLCGYTSPFVNTLRLPHERHLSYHTGVAFAPHNCVIQAWLKANSLKSPPIVLGLNRQKKIGVGGGITPSFSNPLSAPGILKLASNH